MSSQSDAIDGPAICSARVGPGSMDWCHATLDELGDCPQLDEHWAPVCRCFRPLRYYTDCPDCGMHLPDPPPAPRPPRRARDEHPDQPF